MSLKMLFILLLFASCQNKTEGVIMVSPQQVHEAINKEESIQLLDVRTNDEYMVSHLKEAQNICITSDDFKEKVAILDKEKPVYVYCKGGGRSAKAARLLKEMGFKKVYDLQGGLKKWENQKFETVNDYKSSLGL